MPGSPNKLIVNSLIQSLQYKHDPKLYEALLKISDDLNKSYSALFDGILPAVSGKLLDLTEIPEDQLPDFIAFIDKANEFELDQRIIKQYSAWKISWLDTVDNIPSAVKGRLIQLENNDTLVSGNLSFDGTDWNLDDTTDGAGIRFDDGIIDFLLFDGTTLYTPIRIDLSRRIRIGEPAFFTDAAANEVVLPNNKFIRGANFAASATLPLINLDINDLVELGSNPVGATTGEGNITIPRSVTADLPVAGSTRNGILIIDQDTNQLCYYVSGNRYKLAIGTTF